MTRTGVHRVSLFIAGAATFAATAWWAARDATLAAAPHVQPAVAAAPDYHPAAFDYAVRDSSTTPGGAAIGAADPAEAGFAGYVSGKYAVLFQEPTLSARDEARLLEALLVRERLAVAINTARQGKDEAAKAAVPEQVAALAVHDFELTALIRPEKLAAFEVLRDSDMEQFQLDDFAGGIRDVAPLSEPDRRTILYTKLVHRQRFRRVLDESRLMRGELGAEERRYAFDAVSRALGDAKRDFLAEARQYLHDDRQYALLSNYEDSEYAAELEKLRDIADR